MDLELEIESLGFGGSGVARHVHDGVTVSVFVPYTVPGDHVKVKVSSKQKRYWQAELLEVITPSASRRKPHCAHFTICGGCHFLHIKEQVQHSEKVKMLTHILKGIDFRMEPLLAFSPQHYRVRGTFHGSVRDGSVRLGLYAAKSHDLVDIASCPLMHEGVNAGIELFRKACKNKDLPAGNFRLDVIYDTLTHEVHHVLHLPTASLEPWNLLGLQNLTIQHGRKILKQAAKEAHLLVPGHTIKYHPPQFTQINEEVNRALILHIMQKAALKGKESVLDLFCGMGNFSFPLAKDAGHVFGVESHLPSIIAARAHAQAVHAKNVEFICDDAMLRVRKLIAEEKKFHTILLDPPRGGLGDDITYLAKLAPEQFLYVSCNPRELAADLKALVAKGYIVESILPVEMFPQTYHLEVLAHLRRAPVKTK